MGEENNILLLFFLYCVTTVGPTWWKTVRVWLGDVSPARQNQVFLTWSVLCWCCSPRWCWLWLWWTGWRWISPGILGLLGPRWRPPAAELRRSCRPTREKKNIQNYKSSGSDAVKSGQRLLKIHLDLIFIIFHSCHTQVLLDLLEDLCSPGCQVLRVLLTDLVYLGDRSAPGHPFDPSEARTRRSTEHLETRTDLWAAADPFIQTRHLAGKIQSSFYSEIPPWKKQNRNII